MLPDKEIKCPYTGFEKSCREIVTTCTCPKYVHIMGTNPNTGQDVDKWGCIDSYQHMLMIENSQQQRQTGASCDKVANEVSKFHESMAKSNAVTLQLMAHGAGVHLSPMRAMPSLAKE